MRMLLSTFWDIQRQLARLERFMPKQIDLPIVKFRDAFNKSWALPFELCKQWQTFKGLVAIVFTKQQGLSRVNMGQFFVTNVRIGQKLNPAFWSNAIEPYDELSMTMIIDDIEVEDGFCPYKSCGASTRDVASGEVGKRCPNCFRFATISQRKKTSSRRYHRDKLPRSRQKLSIRDSDLDPLCDEIAKFDNMGLEAAPSHGPYENTHEMEDIELYQSIQVVQAILSATNRENGSIEEKSLQTSGGEVHFFNSSVSASSIQIFIRNLKGKTNILRVDSSDTIEMVKNMIRDREGVPLKEQRLIFGGKELDDVKTLSHYGIDSERTLYLTTKSSSMVDRRKMTMQEYEERAGTPVGAYMSIRIKSVDQPMLHLDVRNNDTIEEVKNAIEGKTGVPAEQQHFTYAGNELDDNVMLYQSGLVKDEILFIVLRNWKNYAKLLSFKARNFME